MLTIGSGLGLSFTLGLGFGFGLVLGLQLATPSTVHINKLLMHGA